MVNSGWALIRARSRIFYAFAFGAAFFLLYAETFISTSSTSIAFIREETSQVMQHATAHETEGKLLKSTFTRLQLHSVHKDEVFVEDNRSSYNESVKPLVPPLNVTEEERILWFKKTLPEFDIFNSDRLSRKFHGRVLKFFDSSHDKCSVQFFMTWISPVRSFSKREFLAIESLFKANPRGCLVIVSRTMDSKLGSKIIKPFHDHGFKVVAVTPDLPSLFKNTPAKTWFDGMRAGTKDPGEIPLAQNLSNLIRIAVLYKYGGVYLDTDVIILKDFRGLRNSIGAQSLDAESGRWSRLNNAVMAFDKGHPLLFKFMEEFALTFDGNKWGHNGPYLVSRVVEKVKARKRYQVKILPPRAFYPVDWTRIGGLFKMPTDRAYTKWVEAKLLQLTGGETYAVHLWNKQSGTLKIEEGSVMGRLISDHCIICENIYSSREILIGTFSH